MTIATGRRITRVLLLALILGATAPGLQAAPAPEHADCAAPAFVRFPQFLGYDGLLHAHGAA